MSVSVNCYLGVFSLLLSFLDLLQLCSWGWWICLQRQTAGASPKIWGWESRAVGSLGIMRIDFTIPGFWTSPEERKENNPCPASCHRTDVDQMRNKQEALESAKMVHGCEGFVLFCWRVLSSFSQAHQLPHSKIAKLNLFGKQCVFDTCCEFEANPFRIFFH